MKGEIFRFEMVGFYSFDLCRERLKQKQAVAINSRKSQLVPFGRGNFDAKNGHSE